MRRGHTLIEMTVALTVGATILGIAVALLLSLLRAERASRTHAEQAAVVARLAERFRRDVHAAQRPPTAEATDDGQPAWRFDLSDKRAARYLAAQDRIVWQESRDGTIVRQDAYLLPEGLAATITSEDSPRPGLVCLTLAPREGMASGGEIRIEAALDHDRRWASRRERQEANK